MARIRTIKPELWTDPEFVECSTNARLLFVAALNFASDFGVIADKPKQLKMQCFPADDLDVVPLITELVDHGLWQRRTAPDGASVLLIRTFTAHQRVDKPNPGRWGDPREWPEILGVLPERSSNDPIPLPERSPPEGKGREGKTHTHLDDGFDSFWAGYPRKQSKASTLKAWRRLSQPDREAALAALPAHCALWAKGETRFIAHGATWLNGRRWEDDLPPATANGHALDELILMPDGTHVSRHTLARG